MKKLFLLCAIIALGGLLYSTYLLIQPATDRPQSSDIATPKKGICSLVSTTSCSITSDPQTKTVNTTQLSGEERITMTFADGMLSPSIVSLKQWRSYMIVIDVQTDGVGCRSAIQLLWLDETLQKITKWVPIVFHIQAAKLWTYDFVCAGKDMTYGAQVIVQ